MILISLLLYFCDLHSVASRRRNQNLFNDIFHTAGFDQIGRGKLASTIPEMLSVQSISFEFKIYTPYNRRGNQQSSVAVLSDKDLETCCTSKESIVKISVDNKRRKIYSSVRGTVKKSIPLKLKTWYRVEIKQRHTEAGKTMITVAVNGVAMSSKEIPEVSGTGHLYTAPQLGYPPAVGVTRDVTVIDSDSDGFFADETTTPAKVETSTWCDGGCVWDHMKVKAAQLGCSVYEYKYDGIRCKCFKDRKHLGFKHRMRPGEKYLADKKNFWGKTTRVETTYQTPNPCYDITCNNSKCHDHPHQYALPCKGRNCGNTNCKRVPCVYNGDDLGLGK